MNVFAKRLTGGSIVAAAVLGGLLLASTVVGADSWVRYQGEFNETKAGSGLGYDISGQAKMKISNMGTKVDVEIYGLKHDELYRSHLHRERCNFVLDNGEPSPGGGHYKNEPGEIGAPPNEIWLKSYDVEDLTDSTVALLDEDAAVALADGRADWMARPDGAHTAQSVVLHAPGGAKIACADLNLDNG